MSKKFFYLTNLILILLLLADECKSFAPSKDMQYLIELLDAQLKNENDEYKKEQPTGVMLTHVEIFKKGLIRSLAKYFIGLQNTYLIQSSKRSVDLKKIEIYFNDIDELFKDYYNDPNFNSLIKCNYKFNKVIQLLSDAVANVDFDPKLKDLPYAHFDADKFKESNKFVSNLIEQTYYFILSSSNTKNGINEIALTKIGQALHTLQDFYSHSNWIEMGYENKINTKLGSYDDNFGVPLSQESPKISTCFHNECSKHIIMCRHLKGLSILSANIIGIPINCPIIYYKCKNNVVKDKLTSGYFSNQKFENGSDVLKPNRNEKCNHGGYLDRINDNIAVGGINKDTSYYLFSPRADLHVKAAELAIKHTEYYFDQLRIIIGNGYFDELIGILHKPNNLFDCLFKKLYFLG